MAATTAPPATGRVGLAGTYRLEDGMLSIQLALPEAGGTGRGHRGALLSFAGLAAACESLVMWFRFLAVYSALQDRLDDPAFASEFEHKRLCDPHTQTAAGFAVAANVGAYAADSFLARAIACFERIPSTGRMLRDGMLSIAAFHAVVREVELVMDADILAVIDAEIAHRVATMGGLSVPRVTKTAHAVVAEFDPDAAREARKKAKAFKRVQLAPLDFELADLNITLSTEDAALAVAMLESVVAGLCTDDPRTKDQKMADAARARHLGVPFVCECGRSDCDARVSDADVAARCANIVLHVVVRKDTLDGGSATPAYLDGIGPISAEHVREMAERGDAVARNLDLDEIAENTCQAADPYRPTAAADAAIRGLFGQCTAPGCDRPTWRSDLDHVVEFNHGAPDSGGATCFCNMNPKCRFHHLIKTHCEGWIDSQYVDANGVVWTEVTTPDGITNRQQALNTWRLPEIGHMQCRHGAPVAPGVNSAEEPERARTRLEAKHRYRRQMRAANRRAREADAAAAAVTFDAQFGEPPF